MAKSDRVNTVRSSARYPGHPQYENHNAYFETGAGETLKVRVRTENLSGAQVEYVDVEIVRDSDGDGLSNSLETLGVLTGKNERVYTDPYDADTDGDGLSDSEELGEKHYSSRGVGRTYYLLNSDPTEGDSDGDGFDDFDEFQIGTDPFSEDTDNDGTIDSKDGTPFTKPDEKTADEQLREYHQKVEQTKRAVGEGAVYGEFGAQGKYKRPYADSPYYLVGWIVGSVVPVAEWPADLRDAVTNAGQGDFGEMLLDLVGLLPLVVDDAPKALKSIQTWVKLNPGKADEAYRVLTETGFINNLPENRVGDFYRAFGKETELRRLEEQARASDKFKNTKEFAQKVEFQRKLINEHSVSSKVSKKLELTDIDRVMYDKNGLPVLLLSTNKWKPGKRSEVLARGPGWRHIVARHVPANANSKSDFVVTPGSKATDGTSKFPKSMDPENVKDAIEATVKNGNIPEPKADPMKITYSGAGVNRYGIEEMVVIRDPVSGNIITAYPKN